MDDEDAPKVKRRGRPPKHPAEPTVITAHKIRMLKFPVSPQDDRQVECSACNEKMTFHNFRKHNIAKHYNLAVEKGTNTVMDHNYYARRLMEMKKLMKLSSFTCPIEGCGTVYKSPLGLGHHLTSCGKPPEEVYATYIECDICHKKYPITNINWHKKTHTKPKPNLPTSSLAATLINRKRASALKAKEDLKKLRKSDHKKTDSAEEDSDYEGSDSDGDEASEVAATNTVSGDAEGDGENAANDISILAATVLCDLAAKMSKPAQQLKPDTFTNMAINPLQTVEDENVYDFLPKRLTSIRINVSTRVPPKANVSKTSTQLSTDFHPLKIFDSEITDTVYGNNLLYCGGPISSMAWNPDSRFLAAATLSDDLSSPIVNEVALNPTAIQIYENLFDQSTVDAEVNGLVLRIVLGIKNGFIHHLVWSNFLPEASSADGTDSQCIGHLAFSAGDCSVGILFIQRSYLSMEPNVTLNEVSKSIPFYLKAPEFILVLNENYHEDAGQCTRFDWNDDLEYIAAGYANGLVAVFNVRKVARLLRRTIVDEFLNKTVELKPVWYVRAHTEVVSVVQFNIGHSNFLMTGSHDYNIKIWDLHTRTEIDTKRLGWILDACWLTGWTHIAASTEFLNLSIQALSSPFVKFHPIGSSKGVVNVFHAFNVTSLSFHKGLLAEATEMGHVILSYYDSFARECDYERNKRKKNMIDFSKVSVGIHDGEPELQLHILQQRVDCSNLSVEPSPNHAQDLILHYNLMRVNKVLWSPSGLQLATAYHNGFVTITPSRAKSFFGDARWLYKMAD